jgi:CspA family cold shock protein
MWLKRIFETFTSSSSSPQKKGRVKFFNRKRGYGFIEAESLEKDVFVHVTNIDNELNKGDRVSFEIEKSEKGLEARNVQLLTI